MRDTLIPDLQPDYRRWVPSKLKIQHIRFPSIPHPISSIHTRELLTTASHATLCGYFTGI
jgi:hypothetical protein